MFDTYRKYVPRRTVLGTAIWIAAAAFAGGSAMADDPVNTPTLGQQHDGYLAIDLIFATDRAKTESDEPGEHFGKDRGTLRFGTCRVSIPEAHQRGNIEDSNVFTRDKPRKHVLLLEKPATLERPSFIEMLSERVRRSPSREVLLVVHGYNVTFEEAALRTAQVAYDIEFKGVPVIYSWPAQGNTLSYTVDQINAAWSRPHLVEFLQLLIEHAGATKIHLLGHSLGNRVLSDALVELVRGRAANLPPLFGQIILAAPDIDSEIFARDAAAHLVKCSERVTIYASAKDRAIAGSRTLHRYPRLGEAGKQLTLFRDFERIEVIDATGARETMLGHTYFSVSPRFLDDLQGVLTGKKPIDRDLCAEDGYWAFHR
ncbi:MAG: alpha/beta fold hydrolase [Planctomycetes bacterium]|nr:alpha/beta fold hydrolase [Planctomycetota bacterium]